jgi:putative membrane protein
MQKHHRERKSLLRLISSGFAMGAADVVPGVSGGTIAFILGIYEDLLQAIHDLDIRLFRLLFQMRLRQAFSNESWRFLAAVGSGIMLAVLTVSKILVWGLEQYPELIWSFFFGLVLASVFVVGKRVQRWTPGAYLLIIAGAILSFALVGLVPFETPDSPWFLFISGAAAISAMILPGISGAFILLILGKYHFLLESLVYGNWFPLLFVAAGAVVGLFSFARFLRWLLLRYHDLTVAALIGLIIGALRKVWPWKELSANTPGVSGDEALRMEVSVLPSVFTLEVALAFSLMLTGFVFVIILENLGKR